MRFRLSLKPSKRQTKRQIVRVVIVLLLLITNVLFMRGISFANSCLSAVDAPGCSHGLPLEEYQALLNVMAANPAPAVAPLEPDQENILRYSNTASKTPHIASSYTGVRIDGGLSLPMGWMLKTIRPLPLPAGLASAETPMAVRYQRVYIYKSLKVNGLEWLLIGPGQWVRKVVVAQLVPAPRPGGVGGRWMAVDLTNQTFSAYEDDRLIFATLVSTGRGKYVTRPGLFPIYARHLTDNMSGGMGSPEAYSIYDVPWVQYFNAGMALHGAPWHNNFGYPMSHGCVNMSMTDARWAYEWTEPVPAAPVYVWRSSTLK